MAHAKSHYSARINKEKKSSKKRKISPERLERFMVQPGDMFFVKRRGKYIN